VKGQGWFGNERRLYIPLSPRSSPLPVRDVDDPSSGCRSLALSRVAVVEVLDSQEEKVKEKSYVSVFFVYQ